MLTKHTQMVIGNSIISGGIILTQFEVNQSYGSLLVALRPYWNSKSTHTNYFEGECKPSNTKGAVSS